MIVHCSYMETITMKNIFLPLLIAAVAAGCASNDKKAETTDRSTSPTQSSAGTAGPGSTTMPQASRPVDGSAMANAANLKKTVYFDFDSNVVKDEYQPVVQSNARYAADQRAVKIRIEGNTDERGSREYNLALGQRRAEAVKKVMTVLGVQDNRIETVSYGEEKPAVDGHDESAWAQNRRADIRYGGQ
jgi:peptidoglycan-associated lipoprotein